MRPFSLREFGLKVLGEADPDVDKLTVLQKIGSLCLMILKAAGDKEMSLDNKFQFALLEVMHIASFTVGEEFDEKATFDYLIKIIPETMAQAMENRKNAAQIRDKLKRNYRSGAAFFDDKA
jgi:hypothetical protein